MSLFPFCLPYLTFWTPTPFLFLDRSVSFGPFLTAKYSQTSTNGHLSTTATSLQRQRPLKRVPNCRKNLSITARFFSDWRKCQKWSQNVIHMASQRVIGASLSIHLKCKYSPFLSCKNILRTCTSSWESVSYYTPTSPNGHHSTTATFFCPQGSHCGEVRLYQELTAPIPILLYFQSMFFFKCYGEMLVKCWRNVS